MIQKGFEEAAKKEEVSAHFDGVDIRFNKMEDRLDRIKGLTSFY